MVMQEVICVPPPQQYASSETRRKIALVIVDFFINVPTVKRIRQNAVVHPDSLHLPPIMQTPALSVEDNSNPSTFWNLF